MISNSTIDAFSLAAGICARSILAIFLFSVVRSQQADMRLFFFNSLFIINAFEVFGNIFAFALFLSPLPTFRRIVRNESTEHFSGLPYIYSLLNCLICLWYGMPFITPDITLVATVNSIGACFQLTYVLLYIAYSDKLKKLRMYAMLLAVFAIFAALAIVSLKFFSSSTRQVFVGYLTVASLISMFASPLFVINLVISTKSVEFMPFYLSLATFLMSFSFFAYGFLKYDAFIYVPNGIGTILGIVQLAIYACYRRGSRRDTVMPLLLPQQGSER